MVKPWKQFREIITELYIKDARTLKEVKHIMQEQYSFHASIRSYRHKFDLWDLQKYNCKKRSQRRAAAMQRKPADIQGGHRYPSPPTSPEGEAVLPAAIPAIGAKGSGVRYFEHPWGFDGPLPQLSTDRLLHPHYHQKQRYPKYGYSCFADRKYQHRMSHATNDPWYSIQPSQSQFVSSFSQGSFSPERTLD